MALDDDAEAGSQSPDLLAGLSDEDEDEDDEEEEEEDDDDDGDEDDDGKSAQREDAGSVAEDRQGPAQDSGAPAQLTADSGDSCISEDANVAGLATSGETDSLRWRDSQQSQEDKAERNHVVQFRYDFELSQPSSQGSARENKTSPPGPLETPESTRKRLKRSRSHQGRPCAHSPSDLGSSDSNPGAAHEEEEEILLDEEDTVRRPERGTGAVADSHDKENGDRNLETKAPAESKGAPFARASAASPVAMLAASARVSPPPFPKQAVRSSTSSNHGTKPPEASLFTTGAGKSIAISEERIEAARSKLCSASAAREGSVPKPQQDSEDSVQASLFTTGGGKAVHVQKHSLDVAVQALGPRLASSPGPLREVSLASTASKANEQERPQVASLFTTCGGKRMAISAQALAKAEKRVGAPAAPATPAEVRRPSQAAPTLFTTGAGKKVEISREALENAQSMLEAPATHGSASVTHGSATHDSAGATHGSASATHTNAAPAKRPKDRVESLFSTGAGKSVNISSQALASARAVLQPAPSTPAPKPRPKQAVASLFSTGSGQKVEISQKALENAQSSLAAPSTPSLFSTGAGKRVDVSAQALVNAQKLLGSSANSGNASESADPAATPVRPRPTANGVSVAATPTAGPRRPQLRPKAGASLSENRRPKRPRAFVTPFKNGPNAAAPGARTAASAPPKLKGIYPGGDDALLGSAKKQKTSNAISSAASIGVLDAIKSAERQRLDAHAGFIMEGRPSAASLRENALELGTPKWVLALDAETSACVRFHRETGELAGVAPFPSSEGTYETARSLLLETEGVDEVSASKAWVANHYRWIVWKLVAYQRVLGSASSALARACTLSNVVYDLKYRYERELVRAERPALRKVLEKDAPAGRHMVVCVASVARTGGAHQLVLTDGWYAVQASVDPFLLRLIEAKRISVGTKMHVCGAIMVDNEEGMSPLELATSNPLLAPGARGGRPEPRLRISQNCSFPAAWDAKMGFRPEAVLYKQLGHIQPSGGTTVPGLRAVLVRHFELLFCEREPASGQWVTRTAHEEELARRRHEESLQQARDAIIAEHENAWDDLSQGSGGSAQARAREAVVQRRRDAVSSALAGDPRMPGRREIKTKLRVLLQQPGRDSFAELVMWNPPTDFTRMYPEGCFLELRALTVVRSAKVKHGRSIMLSSNKETRFKLLEKKYPDVSAVCSRQILTVTEASRDDEAASSPFVDLVGILIHATARHAFLCGPAGGSDIVSVLLGAHSALSAERIGLEKRREGAVVVCARDLAVQTRDPTSNFFACAETHHSAIVADPSRPCLREPRWRAFETQEASLRAFLRSPASEEILASAKERVQAVVAVATLPAPVPGSSAAALPGSSLGPSTSSTSSSSSLSTGALPTAAASVGARAEPPVMMGASNDRQVRSTPSPRASQNPQVQIQPPTGEPKPEALRRQERLRLQQEKQAQWRERYKARVASRQQQQQARQQPDQHESRLVLYTRSDEMSSIMVGRKTIDIRRATDQIQNLRMGDIVQFKGAHQHQLVRVKAAIPYKDVQSALEHEPLAKVYPLMAHPTDALELLSKHIGAEDAVYSIHFEVTDTLAQPVWAASAAPDDPTKTAFKSPVK